jgi:hypothetical protein
MKPKPVVVRVHRLAGSWTYTPLDRLGRPSWTQRVEWNQFGGLHCTRTDAIVAAIHAYPKVRLEAEA